MRCRFLFPALLLALHLIAVAAKPASADKVLATAESQATQQQKTILLVFRASWCPGCEDLDRILSAPEIKRILDQHFVVAQLSVFEGAGEHPELENAGSDKVLARFGGVSTKEEVSLPYFVILGADGKLMITSNRPTPTSSKGSNIGLPQQPYEINWFLNMLKTGAPTLSDEDLKAISTYIKREQS